MLKGLGRKFSRSLASMLSKMGFLGLMELMVVALLIAAAVLGLRHMKNYVISLPEFSVNVESINVTNRPAWAPPSLGMEIRQAMPENVSIFDKDLTTKAYEACDSLYWVDEISFVKKHYPNTLDFKMTLRMPIAYVRHAGEPYLTDGKGRCLPHNYYRQVKGVPELFDIKGVANPSPDPGEKWEDMDALLAAIATVEDISNGDICLRAEVTTVDVSNFGGRRDRTKSHITLWTRHQTQIFWGRSSRNPKFNDLATAEKLANLEKALLEYGDFSKVEYVNVYSVKGQCPGKYRKPRGRR